MDILCRHCEMLDIAALLAENKDNKKFPAGKLVRFYCQDPENSRSICPYSGDKEKCFSRK